MFVESKFVDISSLIHRICKVLAKIYKDSVFLIYST